jgi:hypothetical protein
MRPRVTLRGEPHDRRVSPFGDEHWTARASARLGLEPTLRPRGRGLMCATPSALVRCDPFLPGVSRLRRKTQAIACNCFAVGLVPALARGVNRDANRCPYPLVSAPSASSAVFFSHARQTLNRIAVWLAAVTVIFGCGQARLHAADSPRPNVLFISGEERVSAKTEEGQPIQGNRFLTPFIPPGRSPDRASPPDRRSPDPQRCFPRGGDLRSPRPARSGDLRRTETCAEQRLATSLPSRTFSWHVSRFAQTDAVIRIAIW